MKIILTIFHSCLTIIFSTIITNAQTGNITGKISCNGKPIEFATIVIKGTTFGTFSVSARAARNGRNPQTGATIKIKAKKVPKFKAGTEFAEKIAKKGK